MRENLTSGSERGCWKHDLSPAWYRRVPSAPVAYSTLCNPCSPGPYALVPCARIPAGPAETGKQCTPFRKPCMQEVR